MTEASQNNKFFVFIKKHKCLVAFFILTWKLWMILLLHTVIMPVRCYIWEGKEVEVFLTPEEWRKLSGTYESLKDTEWIYYSKTEDELNKNPFLVKNQGLYQPVIYFYGNKHSLSSINNKKPNLNIYIHKNPNKTIGKNTYILYDQKLEKKIIQYNSIIGYYTDPLFGVTNHIECNHLEQTPFSLIKNYLN